MEREYLVFVLGNGVNDDEISYQDAVSWGYDNLDGESVLKLSEAEVNLLIHGNAVEIINDENSSMIGLYEDDWVTSNLVKSNILDQLKEYLLAIDSKDERFLVAELIRLFEFSLKEDKHLYFAW